MFLIQLFQRVNFPSPYFFLPQNVVHDLSLAARYADRLILMQNGRLIGDGDADSVLTEARIASVFGIRVARGFHPFTGRRRTCLSQAGKCRIRVIQMHTGHAECVATAIDGGNIMGVMNVRQDKRQIFLTHSKHPVNLFLSLGRTWSFPHGILFRSRVHNIRFVGRRCLQRA